MPHYDIDHNEIERKTSIYPYVGEVTTHAGDRRGYGYGGLTCAGVELHPSGLVYPAKHRCALKIAMSDRWYALVRRRGWQSAWLVKRWKLDDVCAIEKLRWRVHKRLHRAEAESKVLWERAKELGEVRTQRLDGDGYMLRRLEHGSWREVKTGQHEDAITLLAEIPSPEVDEVSRAIEVADAYLTDCRHAADMIDEVLALAFELADEKPNLRLRQQYRYSVNGRAYFVVVLATGKVTPTRAWPSPGDHHVEF